MDKIQQEIDNMKKYINAMKKHDTSGDCDNLLMHLNNIQEQVKIITYEPVLATVCKHNQGNWCKFKGKCRYRTQVYTAPDENGKQKTTNSFMCYQGHMLNGC